MKKYWIGLTADQTLKKKRLVNFKTLQQSKIKHRIKMKKGKQQSISKMWDNIKQPNVYAIKVPENRLRRQNSTPTDPRAQQTHEENMSRHFIIKLLAINDKEKKL